MKEKYIFLIPARGNSIGVPNKNLYNINGQTLVERAVKVSLKTRLGEVIVSSDSQRILNHSLEVGAHRIIKSPDNISDAKSKTIETVLHTLENLDYEPKYIFIIQPTSPLRIASDIFDCLELMKNHVEASSLASICRHLEPHPIKMFEKNDCYLKHLINSSSSEEPRQDLKEVYKLNGAIYMLTQEAVKDKKILSDKTIYYEMPENRSVNIDTKWDIILLNALIRDREVNLVDY